MTKRKTRDSLGGSTEKTTDRLSLHQRKAFASGQSFLEAIDGEWRPVTDLDWSALINPNLPRSICRNCKRTLPVSCFQSSGVHPDCVICEQQAAEAYRAEHCWEVRGESVLRHHMRVERNEGLHTCTRLEDYCRLTGVTVDWLSELMRSAWERNDSCHHCETAGLPSQWRSICPEPGRDLSRMTVDRTDRTRLLTRDNLTLMCLPGNIAKGQTDAPTYNDRQAYWRLHNHST